MNTSARLYIRLGPVLVRGIFSENPVTKAWTCAVRRCRLVCSVATCVRLDVVKSMHWLGRCRSTSSVYGIVL